MVSILAPVQTEAGQGLRVAFSLASIVLNGSNFAAGYALVSAANSAIPSAIPSAISPAAATSCTTACTATSVLATSSDKVTAVGAGVGLGVGIPLLAALLGVMFLWRREKRVVEGLRTKQNNEQMEQKREGGYETHTQYVPLQELEPSSGAKELPVATPI
ncbi:MAG: hypothetical protein Q9208_008434 [Pyrenodesmia sp. 3 TL-2023]